MAGGQKMKPRIMQARDLCVADFVSDKQKYLMARESLLQPSGTRFHRRPDGAIDRRARPLLRSSGAFFERSKQSHLSDLRTRDATQWQIIHALSSARGSERPYRQPVLAHSSGVPLSGPVDHYGAATGEITTHAALSLSLYEVVAKRKGRDQNTRDAMNRKIHLLVACVAAWLFATPSAATAEETIKIGFLGPLTGPFAQNGKQMKVVPDARKLSSRFRCNTGESDAV
jgi:hypothetical protein